jgi:hypothetical protein
MLSSLFQWKGEPAEAKARTEGQGGGVLFYAVSISYSNSLLLAWID